MNPWPDDYTEAPDAHDAVSALRSLADEAAPFGNRACRSIGHYLHHLTEELAGLQKVCDEQAAELASIERCDQCDGGFW